MKFELGWKFRSASEVSQHTGVIQISLLLLLLLLLKLKFQASIIFSVGNLQLSVEKIAISCDPTSPAFSTHDAAALSREVI